MTLFTHGGFDRVCARYNEAIEKWRRAYGKTRDGALTTRLFEWAGKLHLKDKDACNDACSSHACVRKKIILVCKVS
jgi:hypothetical protein